MILSLLPVSNKKLPLGGMTPKKPAGTVIGLVDAPDCSALFAMVKPPELNAYIFIPAGDCASGADANSKKASTPETMPRVTRFIALSSLAWSDGTSRVRRNLY